MANNSVNDIQLVVSNGVVVAKHGFLDDLYDIYPHSGYAYFDYNSQATVNVAAGTGLTESAVVTINDTMLIQDPTSGTVVAVATSKGMPISGSLPDPRLTMTLAAAKTAVISQLNRILTHQILATYPLQMQNDIIRQGAGYASGDLTNMATFIDGQKSHIATLIAAVNALTTVSAVIAYNVWQ